MRPDTPQANFIGPDATGRASSSSEPRCWRCAFSGRSSLPYGIGKWFTSCTNRSTGRSLPLAISPHANWIRRVQMAPSYCHEHDSFRDFVFARILKIKRAENSEIDPKQDRRGNGHWTSSSRHIQISQLDSDALSHSTTA